MDSSVDETVRSVREIGKAQFQVFATERLNLRNGQYHYLIR